MKVDIYVGSDDAHALVNLLVPAGTNIEKAPFYGKIKQYLHGSTPSQFSVEATPALLGSGYERSVRQIKERGYALNTYGITFESEPPRNVR
jgi:hypothetical protein